MKPYADTNFYTRLYLEFLPQHDQAIDLITQAGETGAVSLPVTWLHRIELVNALQLHVFAGREIGQMRVTPEQAALAWAAFREHLQEGPFMHQVVLDTGSLEEQVEELSLRHTARHGFRAYDLLHVAFAVLLGCDTFWSFDFKAVKLARLEGLHCPIPDVLR